MGSVENRLRKGECNACYMEWEHAGLLPKQIRLLWSMDAPSARQRDKRPGNFFPTTHFGIGGKI